MFIEITTTIGSKDEPRFINISRVEEVKPYKDAALIELISEGSSTKNYVTKESYNEVVRMIKSAIIK